MIVFPVVLEPNAVFGGVKVIYRHVELLNVSGIDAVVFNPDGHPSWFKSKANVITTYSVSPNDTIVFAEAFQGIVKDMLKKQCHKMVFCQNHYNLYLAAGQSQNFSQMGIDEIYAVSIIIARYLVKTFGYKKIAVIPPIVDPSIFNPPHEKKMQIAYMPRKLGKLTEWVKQTFVYRYPQYRHISWVPIISSHEEKTAEILKESAIFLSFSHQEGFGLPPVEAMACGCLVIGLHGEGGLEYANSSNGFWFASEQINACVDELAVLISAIEKQECYLNEMRAAGYITASLYYPNRIQNILVNYFQNHLKSFVK